jgi:hypothetical protein
MEIEFFGVSGYITNDVDVSSNDAEEISNALLGSIVTQYDLDLRVLN